MRILVARLGAVLLLLAVSFSAHSEVPQGPAPVELLDQVNKIVTEQFYNPRGLSDFQSTLKFYRETERSDGEVGAAIAQALRALAVSHTGRYTPDQIEYYELMDIFRPAGMDHRNETIVPGGSVNYAGIGMVPRTIDGRIYAAMIYHGLPADRAGLRVGDEIVSVDGKPYQPIASFRDRTGPVSMLIRRHADGPPQRIEIPVATIRPNESLRNAIRHSVRVVETDGRRIGYLRVWTYASGGLHSLMTELLSSEPLRSADGLVLDLRSRWGGSASEAADFFLGRAREMTIVDRDGTEKTVVTRWRKPVVAIIDQGTRSSMEIFAQALKQAGVPLIGTRSAGAVLAGRGFMLGDHSLLVLAVNDVKIDGQKLEGVGVSPDIEVPYDIRYAAGHDPQFDRAVAELLRKLMN